jgi:hypothetical protein
VVVVDFSGMGMLGSVTKVIFKENKKGSNKLYRIFRETIWVSLF